MTNKVEELRREAERLLSHWDMVAHEAMGYHTPGSGYTPYDWSAAAVAKQEFLEAEQAYQRACETAGIAPVQIGRPQFCH